ncbi:hypothetical protein BB559_007438 [Furculomyces boomerangus]|uniref:PCI domain-containing protein n=2 Tax=Harpellales TaxID=61421 RepID=A0A2T9XXB3_9FUNG|nr:hypothetical protein BB559_007438 [Furculomyces boomerangus]PVZ98327.1 hypothetical protein BB558_005674 [Smittium angustum]
MNAPNQHQATQLLVSTTELIKNHADPIQINSNFTQLKKYLISNYFLDSKTKTDESVLVLNRRILELGAEYALSTGQVESFESYISQLFVYYFDYSQILPPSEQKCYYIGLYLLFLLTQNRISDFHLLLERLEYSEIESNQFIVHPIKVEQALMEGSYKKVYLARNNVPSPSFAFLVDILMSTIRNEIAKCANESYDYLPINDAKSLLFCNSIDEFYAIAKSNGWEISPKESRVYFKTKKNDESFDFDPNVVIEQSLSFAQELERIV